MAIAPTEAAPAEARAAIMAWLVTEHGQPDLAEVATLLASELVTNSIRHAGLAVGQPLRLRADLRPATLRLAIADEGTDGTVERRAPEPGLGGLGLDLVNRLSREWGVDRSDAGTTVWL